MTKHEIAKFISRIFSIYIFITAIRAFINIATFLSAIFMTADKTTPIVMQYLSVAPSVMILLLYLLLAVFLWVRSDYFAKIFVGGSEENDDKLVIAGTDLEPIAYSVIGLYLMVRSIPSLAGLAASKFLISGIPSEPATSFIAPVIELSLGVWLFYNSVGPAKFIKRLRSAGLHRDELEKLDPD